MFDSLAILDWSMVLERVIDAHKSEDEMEQEMDMCVISWT